MIAHLTIRIFQFFNCYSKIGIKNSWGSVILKTLVLSCETKMGNFHKCFKLYAYLFRLIIFFLFTVISYLAKIYQNKLAAGY